MDARTATDGDVRAFRATLRALRKENSRNVERRFARRALGRVNQSLGNPRRVVDALRQASRGVAVFGDGARARDRVGKLSQFLRLYADSFRFGTYADEFYLQRSYLSERRREVVRQFPFVTQSYEAQLALIARTAAPQYERLQDKLQFAARCAGEGIPHVPILAVFADGSLTHHGLRRAEDLPAIDLFSKPVEGSAGAGTSAWLCRGGGFVNAAAGELLTAASLVAMLCEQSRSRFGPMLLQPAVGNHRAMAPLTGAGLATLRMVTVRAPSGSLELLPPVLKMPIGDMIQDNLAAGGLAAPVDVLSGAICGGGVHKDRRVGIVETESHPDSGAVLKGFRIPFWREAVDLAAAAHRAFAALPFVGWDIAVTEEGPLVVEGNGPFDPDLTVLPHRITLSDTPFIPFFNHHWANSRPGAGDGAFVAAVHGAVRA